VKLELKVSFAKLCFVLIQANHKDLGLFKENSYAANKQCTKTYVHPVLLSARSEANRCCALLE